MVLRKVKVRLLGGVIRPQRQPRDERVVQLLGDRAQEAVVDDAGDVVDHALQAV